MIHVYVSTVYINYMFTNNIRHVKRILHFSRYICTTRNYDTHRFYFSSRISQISFMSVNLLNLTSTLQINVI